MGFLEAFMDELSKVAQTPPPAAVKSGAISKIKKFIKEHPYVSGGALGYMLRGILGGGGEQ